MRTTWSAVLLFGAGALAADGAKPADTAAWRSKVNVVRNPAYPLDVTDKLLEDTMPKIDAWLMAKKAAGKNNNCTLENAAVRREWSDLSVEQREEYVRAVTCLMKKPPTSDQKRFPGAKSRFDDFVAFHMTHAQQLHDTLHLFHAHRYYIWAYEKALRDECGYTGYQPYMNIDRYADDPIHSPLFDGGPASMGGNGKPDPGYRGLGNIKSGGGGGCVTSGPFSDMVVSLGPVSPTGNNIPKNPLQNGQGYNPRCLRRDINRNAAQGATADRAYSLLMNKDINSFYNRLLGQPPNRTDPYGFGIHTAGHYIHAVDPGGDAFTSPGDPVFYFHHGMLDRFWWMWQMQDPDTRIDAWVNLGAAGGGGGHNHGKRAGPEGVKIDLEWLAPAIKLTDANDQLGGAGGMFCYVYV